MGAASGASGVSWAEDKARAREDYLKSVERYSTHWQNGALDGWGAAIEWVEKSAKDEHDRAPRVPPEGYDAGVA